MPRPLPPHGPRCPERGGLEGPRYAVPSPCCCRRRHDRCRAPWQVGIWDLVDEHILPAIFTSCVKEPSAGCAAVKLSLICIGALGMYWTRSLYGDRMVQPSQFQPIA